MRVAEDICEVRGLGVVSYVIRQEDELYLVDGGFVGGIGLLTRTLKKAGWSGLKVRGVLLTHGHLDHTLNLAKFQQIFGAWVAAPQQDAAHILGAYPYKGISRFCGLLEAVGRPVLRYKPCAPDRWFKDGDEFPLLGGLRVIELPGHTAGHVGFHSPTRRLLFCADLFASFRFLSHLPPPFLNTSADDLHRSVSRVLAMDLDGLLPNHGSSASPAVHLARFRRLAARKERASDS
jgi:glyoxylase-like metal-dependent hydrolase (beta-lactamase superfamily II)